MTAAAGSRRSVELACEEAGKNHAFCPRAVTVPRLAAESAAGDFQPIDQWSGIWKQTRNFVDRFIEGTSA
jgi:hypothetical protein